MSNLFDALNKSGGAFADSVRPILHGRDAVQAPALASGAGARNGSGAAPIGEPMAREVRTVALRVAEGSPILPFDQQGMQANEQYRILRTRLSQHPRQPRTILVSSAEAGDGKSVSVVNTGGALSLKADMKVLLVDADLRRPSLHKHLGLPQSPGLTDVLMGTCALEDAMLRAEQYPNLYILTAGTPATKPAELLDSRAWRSLCERVRGLFRYVILDSPPVTSVADYDLIQAVCDGVVLVIRPDHTSRVLCRRALETVPKDKLLGVVLNWIPEWFLGRHASPGYYYYAGYQKG